MSPPSPLTLRDEFPALLPGPETATLAEAAVLFEEFVATAAKAGDISLPLAPRPHHL